MEKDNKRVTLRSLPYALRSNKIAYTSILLLSFLGFLDSSYLTILSITRQFPPCSVTHGCETVLTSRFASVGPIPLAAIGILYFIAVMILTILIIQGKHRLKKLLFGLTSAGFITGLLLIYIQAKILHAFCQYCLLVELILTALCLAAGWIYFRGSKEN
jgi:uncharacterized membrane protein